MLITLDLVGTQFFPALSSCEPDFYNAFLVLLKAAAELQRTSGLQIGATAKCLGNLVLEWFWGFVSLVLFSVLATDAMTIL